MSKNGLAGAFERKPTPFFAIAHLRALPTIGITTPLQPQSPGSEPARTRTPYPP